MMPVNVKIFNNHGESSGERVGADMYLWDGEMKAVSSGLWDLGERLGITNHKTLLRP